MKNKKQRIIFKNWEDDIVEETELYTKEEILKIEEIKSEVE